MSRIFFFFISLLVLASIPGCREKKTGSPSLEYQSVNPKLIDSISRYRNLATIYKVKDNRLSCYYSDRALSLAAIVKTDQAYVLAYTAKSTSYLQTRQDSSYFYASKALMLTEDPDLMIYRPDLFINLGLLHIDAEEPKTALILVDSAINLSRQFKNNSTLAVAYNVLGEIHCNIFDTNHAVIAFDSSYAVAARSHLDDILAASLANIAKMQSNPEERISLAKKAIAILKNTRSNYDAIASLMVNIGYEYDVSDSGFYYQNEALKIARKYNLPFQEIIAYNNLAYIYLDRGMTEEAERCIRDISIPLAIKINNQDWLSTLYDTYVDILIAKKEFEKAIKYERESVRVRSEVERQRAASQIRLLDAMLDLKNKQMIIRDKDRELKEHNYRESELKSWLVISLLIVLVVLLVLWWNNLRGKLKLQREKMNSAQRIIAIEEHEKKKIAMDLHDIAGQYIMEIIGEVENARMPDEQIRNQTLEKVQHLSGQLREISHRLSSAMIGKIGFSGLIRKLCGDLRKFSGMNIRLEIPESLPEPDHVIKIHAFRIIQEILGNAVKYAPQATIDLTVAMEGNELKIGYSDNGPGFSVKETDGQGMGLMNIAERAKLVDGKAILDTSPGFGVSWEIILPITNSGSGKSKYL